MSKKIIALWSLRVTKNIIAVDGWTISKGTRLFITNDSAPIHPREGYKLLIARVDNGTGHLDLCCETCFRNTEIKGMKINKPAEDIKK